MSDGWIGVDLDGTLAYYDHWRGIDHIGEPIPLMLRRVRAWLAEGRDVRIFTARVSGPDEAQVRAHINQWCWKYLGRELPVTNAKDFGMVELWDDRAVQVIPNTGVPLQADEVVPTNKSYNRAAHIARDLREGRFPERSEPTEEDYR